MHTRKLSLKKEDQVRRNPSVRFAIVGNPRTGSSHLVSLLDSHPDIACWDDEILDEGEAFDTSPFEDPRDFLRKVVFDVNAKAVGFKLLWDALERTDGVWNLLKDLEIRLVHTCRSNALDGLLSYRLAKTNNSFTSWYGAWTVTRIALDPGDCVAWFEQTRLHDEEIRRHSQEHGLSRVEIEYEELVRTQDKVLEFLGMPKIPLTSRLVKQRKGTQSELITNYVELKSTFKGTPWIRFFED